MSNVSANVSAKASPTKLVRNTLNLNKTIKLYTQLVKVLKRQINVKLIDQISTTPDFCVGTFTVGNSSVYHLVFRCSIPTNASLIVDIWGLSQDQTVHRLNQIKISSSTTLHEITQKFQTYPKTKEVFFAFKLDTVENNRNIGEFGRTSGVGMQYLIQYIYLDSRYPLAKGIETSSIPMIGGRDAGLNHALNISCNPTVICDMDLNNPLKPLGLNATSINVDLFDKNIINYFLNERGIAYLQALKFNISNCMVKGSGNGGEIDGDNNAPKNLLADLVVLQDNIKSQNSTLERQVSTVQRLIQKKQALEKDHENPTAAKEKVLKYEDKITFLNKLLTALNNKQSYLRSLNVSTKIGMNDDDRKSVIEMIEYYQSRIEHDKTVIQNDLNVINQELKAFNEKILEPQMSSLNINKDQIAEIDKEYKERSILLEDLKTKINRDIAVFVLKWYYWIMKQLTNLPRV